MNCKGNLGMLNQRLPMTFPQNAACIHGGISLPGSVVLGKSGATENVVFLIVNESSHNMQLDKTTYLGNVKIGNLITPLQIKKVSAIKIMNQ